MTDPAATRTGGRLGAVPPPTIADIDGLRPAGRARRRLVAAVVMVLPALFLTACSQSRQVTINSECGTDVLVDWLYRSQGGSDVVEEGYVIEAGEHVYADAVETEYIALLVDGEVLAETSLPADLLDEDGANPFPPMTLPAEACDRLEPAPVSESGDGGY